jgi:hypothetical protein
MRGLKLSDGTIVETDNEQEYNDFIKYDPQAKELESYVTAEGDTVDFTIDETDAIQEFLKFEPKAKSVYAQKKSEVGTSTKDGATASPGSSKRGEKDKAAVAAGYSSGLLKQSIEIFNRENKWEDEAFKDRYFYALAKKSNDPAEIDGLRQRVEEVGQKTNKYKSSLEQAKADSLNKPAPTESTSPAAQRSIDQQAATAASDIKKEQEKKLAYFNREVNGALATIPLPPDYDAKVQSLSQRVNDARMRTLEKLEPEGFKEAMGLLQQDVQKGVDPQAAYDRYMGPLLNMYGEEIDKATSDLYQGFTKLDEIKKNSVFNDGATLNLARKMYHDFNRDKAIEKDYAMYLQNFKAISKAGTSPLTKELFAQNSEDPSVKVSKVESGDFDQNVAKYNYLRTAPGTANQDLLRVQQRQLKYDVDALTFMNEQAGKVITDKKASPEDVYKAQLVRNGVKKTMGVLGNIYPQVVKRKADQETFQLKTDLKAPLSNITYPGGEYGKAIFDNVGRGIVDYIGNVATGLLDQPGTPDMFTKWAESISDAQFRINEGWFGIPSNMQAPLIDRYTTLDVNGKKIRFYTKGDKVADIKTENGYPVSQFPSMMLGPQEFYDKNKSKGKETTDFRGDLILPKLARTGTDMFTLLYGANKFGKLMRTQKGGLVLSGYLTEYENAYTDFLNNNPLIDDADARLYAGVRSAIVSSLELVNPQAYLFKETMLNKLKGDYIDYLTKGVDRYSAIKLAAKDINKEGMGEILQEYMQEFGGMGVDYGTNLALGEQAVEIDFNPDEFIETGILTYATAGLFKGFTDIRNSSDLEIDALYTAVGNYDKLTERVEMQAARGDLTPEQKDRAVQVLGDLKLAYDQVPPDVDDATKVKLFKLIAAKNTLLKNSEGLVQSPEVQDQTQRELNDIDNLIDYTYKIKVPRYVVDGKPIGRADILRALDNPGQLFQNIVDGKTTVEVFNDPAIEARFKGAYDQLNENKRKEAEAKVQAEAQAKAQAEADAKAKAEQAKTEFDAQQKQLPPGKTEKPVAIQDQNKPKGDKPTVKGEQSQSKKLAEQKTEIENTIAGINTQLTDLQKQEVKDQEMIDALTADLQTKKQELEAVEINLVDQSKLEAGTVTDISQGLQEDGVTWVKDGVPLRWITSNFDESGALMSSDFLDEEGNHIKITDENELFDMAISMSNFWQNKMAEAIHGKATPEMVDARSRAARKLRSDPSAPVIQDETIDSNRKKKAEKVKRSFI